MVDYSSMTQEEFDQILEEVIYEEIIQLRAEGSAMLLGIPGVYEVLSEYFNNAVLDKWKESQCG